MESLGRWEEGGWKGERIRGNSWRRRYPDQSRQVGLDGKGWTERQGEVAGWRGYSLQGSLMCWDG